MSKKDRDFARTPDYHARCAFHNPYFLDTELWSRLREAQADELKPKKKPYLDESRPLTGVPADYVTDSCEPRFNCHTDKQGFERTMDRMNRNLGEAIKDIRRMEIDKA